MPNISPNMNLVVPIPNTGVTGTGDTGPLYAQNISNDLLNTIDSHDHSSGKGVKITSAGINIISDLGMNDNNLNQIRSSRYFNLPTGPAGVGDVSSTYVLAGNLWFNNSAGTPVQLTSGSSIIGVSTTDVLPFQAINNNWTILNTDTYVLVSASTNVHSLSVNLPAANSVNSGRWFIICDATGNALTNNITVIANGSDTIAGGSSIVVGLNFGAVMIASNGTNAWELFNVVGPTGSIGPQGIQGATGILGPAGALGPTGSIGPQGIQGVQGATGPANGIVGPAGINAYSQTAGFTQPNINASIAIQIPSGNWMQVGQVVFIPSGGYYRVASGTVPTMSLTNLGYTGIPVGSSVGAAFVSPAGIIGAQGLQGVTGTQGPAGAAGITGIAGSATGLFTNTVVTALDGINSSTAIKSNTLNWTSVNSVPVISQTTTNVGNALGNNMTIEAQSCSGSNSTGGSLILQSGAGVAANGGVQINSGTTPVIVFGSEGVAYQESSNVVLTTGTTTLTSSQYIYPYIILTGSISGAVTVVFPDVPGSQYYVDATAVTLNGHTITLQVNSNNWATTIGTSNIYNVIVGSTGKFYGTALTP